ncbi:hypothetical protein RRG08_051850 [Elysia crispata]|uniref:Uncharacterized protein n=1 Tax=Elysia crispata TaxID=231223 RepID=A0AAE1DCA4_9GAST|nr:hypothetical protein RRG08_051850 [Elysia crispata]
MYMYVYTEEYYMLRNSGTNVSLKLTNASNQTPPTYVSKISLKKNNYVVWALVLGSLYLVTGPAYPNAILKGGDHPVDREAKHRFKSHLIIDCLPLVDSSETVELTGF